MDILNKDKLKAAANLWPNYWTDYHPLVDMAKEHGLPFIATNIPRRYASFVYQHGLSDLDSLSDGAKAFLPALPIPFDINFSVHRAAEAVVPWYGVGGPWGEDHGGATLDRRPCRPIRCRAGPPCSAPPRRAPARATRLEADGRGGGGLLLRHYFMAPTLSSWPSVQPPSSCTARVVHNACMHTLTQPGDVHFQE